MRFEIILGRLTAFHLRGGQAHQSKGSPGGPEPFESISVSGEAAAPAFRYERCDRQQQLTIEFVDGSDVKIQSKPQGESGTSAVVFTQGPRGGVQLTIGREDSRKTILEPSLWHLLLAHPEITDDYLVPCLHALRPDWQLMEMAKDVEYELFRFAEGRPAISRKQVFDLLAQLDSRRFSERQAADRQLRNLGVAVLPYLSQADHSTFTGEQRLRIRRIRQSLAAPMADTAERVAVWLSNDKVVWLALLSHHEPAKREVAASRLTGIHPGAIHFDPFAEESLRRKQIAQLRSRLDGTY